MRPAPLSRTNFHAGRAGLAVETLELHGLRDDSFDLTLSAVRPRTGHGAPYLDIGLLQHRATGPLASTARIPLLRQTDLRLISALRAGVFRRSFENTDGRPVELTLAFTPLAHRGGVALLRARGEVSAPFGSLRLDDVHLLVAERRAARRPYAWARATLFGSIDGDPIVCLLETARRRAGSVVLPAIGRLSLFGPGAQHLPRGCVLAPLPARAEYGTGQLRAAALAPGYKLELEVGVPIESTALFEVVDPNGDAAYAHRALDASARLRLRGRKREVVEIALRGRYEWGARAGDPRVEQRAWRA